MKTGITKYLTAAHLAIVKRNFELRKRIFGFKNANKLMRVVDKRAIIPILRNNKAIVGENCDLETPLTFHNCLDYNNITIGDDVHIGKETFIDLADQIYIGNAVTISMQNTFITHIDVAKSNLRHQYPKKTDKIIVHDHCYLGVNTTVLKGVELGESCIVAAGSLVKDSFPPYSLIGGIPARKIRDIRKPDLQQVR